MKTSDFKYNLPQELIAQVPLDDRSSSKLLVMDKHSGEIQHRIFRDITEFLNPGDCLVLNNTRVLPARLIGEKEKTGGKIEFLLLSRKNEKEWEIIVKPGKKAKPGSRFEFGGGKLRAEVLDTVNDGNRIVRFEYDGLFENVLDELGEMPLPPYITAKLEDRERYQTVYSKHNGSAAAPTAGLHFTPELLEAIRAKGVEIAYVTLNVGLGTFRPVKCENVLEHKMHSESFEITEETAKIINEAKAKGKKLTAVGTTTVRTLETAFQQFGEIKACKSASELFIYPPYEFKVVDSLITNFHLPKSTLLMLVSALAGKDFIFEAYDEAIKNEYRFFSYGDCMFIK